MLDPKTSPSESVQSSSPPNRAVAFQDRLYVAGNASFLCLVVAIFWSALFITKLGFSVSALIVLASPLVATGATVLIAGCSKHVVPKANLASPLHVSIPLIWCLTCYLAILLISTQETEAQSVPDQLIPALAWSKMENLLPVCAAQILILGLCIFIDRRRSRV